MHRFQDLECLKDDPMIIIRRLVSSMGWFHQERNMNFINYEYQNMRYYNGLKALGLHCLLPSEVFNLSFNIRYTVGYNGKGGMNGFSKCVVLCSSLW